MTQEALRFNRKIADEGLIFNTFYIQDIAQRVYEYEYGHESDLKDDGRNIRELMDRITPLQLYQLALLFDECAQGCQEPIAEMAHDIVHDAHHTLAKIARNEEQLPEITGWTLESLNRRRLERNLMEFHLKNILNQEQKEKLARMPVSQQVETDQAIQQVLDRHKQEIESIQNKMASEMIELIEQ